MAERFHLLCLASVAALALASQDARAQIAYGELDLVVEPEPKGDPSHGYTEYRVFITNKGTDDTHRVTLTLPAESYSGRNGRGSIQSISRTVLVGPGLTSVVSLFQPSYPEVLGNGIAVRIDGRLANRQLRLNPTSSRGAGSMGHAYGYARRGARFSSGFGGSSGPSLPLVLRSMRVPPQFNERKFAGAAGGPGGVGAGGGGPGAAPAPPAPPVPPGGAPGGPIVGRGGMGIGGPSVIPGFNAQVVPSEMPISRWSSHWLGYSRYDGIVVTREDVEELQRGSNETRAILLALWQFTETGGVLLVLGPGDIPVPTAWKRHAVKKAGFTFYQIGFGQCLISSDRKSDNWEFAVEINDRLVETLTGKFNPQIQQKLKGINRAFETKEKLASAMANALGADFVRLQELNKGEELLGHFVTAGPWSAIQSAVNQTTMPWQSSKPLTDLNTSFPVVDNLGVPVKSLFVLMVFFGVALGPVNLVVLGRKKKRIWMLWTVPVLSFVTCLVVFGYMIIAEGWQGHARVGGITFLDEIDHRATSLGRATFYSPLTPGDGLRFGEDTEVWVQGGEQGAFSSSCAIDWTQGQHLSRGWVTARVPAHFAVRSSETRRERLNVHREPDGRLGVLNGLGVDIKELWLADEKGALYSANDIAAGARATLERVTRKLNDGLPEKSWPADGIVTGWPTATWRKLYTTSDWMSSAKDAREKPWDHLGPRTYLAVVDGSPFHEQALRKATVRGTESVVLGVMADLGK